MHLLLQVGVRCVSRKLYGEQAKFFEAENKPRIKHTKIGTVSMVNGGNNMHGSQVGEVSGVIYSTIR